jgi:protoporphyrinogen oxidase
MIKYDKVVVGAGLAGLSFAYHYDKSLPVIEALDSVGGLVRTIDFNGCKFDLAPHLLHLKNPYVRELVFNTLGLKVENHVRKASIYYDNVIIPYPFELNLLGLSDKTKKDCLNGLEEVKHFSKEEEQEIRKGSYRDYALKAFGSGIANHYLLPYNRKIWDTDPTDMTCEFMSWLITADKDQIIHNASQPNKDKFGYNTEFYYPVLKGIQDLSDVFANTLSNIQLSTKVVEYDTKNRIITLSNGEKIQYKTLINTAPLRTVIEQSDRDDLKDLAAQLSYTSVYTVNIVIKGTVPDSHWMYFPDKNLSFYRISFPKNYFKKSTPNNEQIIAVEVGSRDHNKSIKEIQDKVVAEIKAMPIFNIEEIVFVHCLKIPVAYCIYEHKRPEIVNKLISELEKSGIYQTGRYGQWGYSAMQDAIMYGKDLADKFLANHA